MPSIKNKKTKTKRSQAKAQNFRSEFLWRAEEGDATEGEWGRDRVGGVCRSSVLLPFASCPLKWCKIYEARPPFCAHFIEFYFLRQKWSAESRHCCCCCYCEWCCCCFCCCCCALCCCCCSSSCFVIYCLQLPNLFLCFCCKFTILFCGLFDAAGIPPPSLSTLLLPLTTPCHTIDSWHSKTFLLFLLAFFLFGFMCASFRASIVQQLFLQHQKSTRGNARNKVM